MSQSSLNRFIDRKKGLVFDDKMSYTETSSTSVNSIFDYAATNGTVSTAVTPSNSFERSQISFDLDINLTKSIILLSGLPATGKSTISKQLKNFLNKSTNYKTKIFNCGKMRREKLNEFHTFEFFDPNNKNCYKQREQFAIESLNEIIDELNTNKINVGILDATNTTIARRQMLVAMIKDSIDLDNLVVLDIRCDDARLINYNIHAKTCNEDYKDRDYDMAVRDFKLRLDNYNKAYEQITTEELAQYGLTGYFNVNNGGQEYHSDMATDDRLLRVVDGFFVDYCAESTPRYIAAVDQFYVDGGRFKSV